MLDPLPQLTIALSLAVLFAASAVHKLLAWQEWPGVVRNYRLVPDGVAGAVAAALLCAELLAAGALLWTPVRPAAGLAAAALLVSYAAALWINLKRGRTSIDCGCFGSRLRQGIAPWMMWRNAVLAALALTLLLPTSARPLSGIEVALAAASVVALAFLYPVLAIALRAPPPTFDQNYRSALRARAGG